MVSNKETGEKERERNREVGSSFDSCYDTTLIFHVNVGVACLGSHLIFVLIRWSPIAALNTPRFISFLLIDCSRERCVYYECTNLLQQATTLKGHKV